jgi:hypothetical protein
MPSGGFDPLCGVAKMDEKRNLIEMYFFRTSYAECCLLLELYFLAQISQALRR